MAGGLLSMFRDVPDAVRQFRVHQYADFSITLEVVEGTHPRARQQVADVVRGMHETLRNQVSLRVEFVDSLPYTGGKMKFVTSDLEPEADEHASQLSPSASLTPRRGCRPRPSARRPSSRAARAAAPRASSGSRAGS